MCWVCSLEDMCGVGCNVCDIMVGVCDNIVCVQLRYVCVLCDNWYV